MTFYSKNKRLPATQTLEFQGSSGTGRLLLVKGAGYLKKLKRFSNGPPHFILAFLKMTPIAMETTNILATNLVEVRHRESNLHERPPLVSDHLP